MLEIRPDLQSAYDSLRYQGQQFLEPHEITLLDGPTYAHPRKGDVPIKIDRGVLAEQGTLYVGDLALRNILREYDIETATWGEAANLLGRHLGPENNRLVWGFSGYATGGLNPATGEPFGYQSEADGLLGLYDYLIVEGKLPSLVVDGGVSEGFLALNSVVAQSAGVRTLGFLPEQGLAAAGIRDDMVVAGETYEGREKAVGTADVLVCAGGDKGTARECVRAIQGGAAVLMLKFTDYPPASLPNTFHMDEDLRAAYESRRLVMCESLDEIPDSVDKILQVDVKSSRPLRSNVINDFLSPRFG